MSLIVFFRILLKIFDFLIYAQKKSLYCYRDVCKSVYMWSWDILEKIYTATEFAKIIGITVKCLQRWDREGILLSHRTITNRRFYTEEDFEKYTQKIHK